MNHQTTKPGRQEATGPERNIPMPRHSHSTDSVAARTPAVARVVLGPGTGSLAPPSALPALRPGSPTPGDELLLQLLSPLQNLFFKKVEENKWDQWDKRPQPPLLHQSQDFPVPLSSGTVRDRPSKRDQWEVAS